MIPIAHGNAINCGVPPGTQLTPPPGSASFGITVAGTNDQNTVTRADDAIYTQFMTGPRSDFNLVTPDLLALKPDISAPGENIVSVQRLSANGYFSLSGTSMASPQVAGAAAVILQARPTIDPDSLKDLLKRNADTTNNVPQFPAVDPVWDNAFGAGMMNVWAALNAAAATDVLFPTCIGPPASPGQPCALTPPLPSWNNTVDISTASAPQVGIANTITALVRNSGGVPATVLVSFGVYVFAAGNNQFFHVGTQQATIPAGMTVAVNQPWTPAAANHQCVQVTIAYGLDTNYGNNVTQRNLQVAPSVYEVQVENPFMVPARFKLEAKSDRRGWECRMSDTAFSLHPFADCPKQVRVTFDPPGNARPGERANCDVGVYATPEGTRQPRLIGGVTVQTFIPKPCRVVGIVVDAKGNPVNAAHLIFTPPRAEARTPGRTEKGPQEQAGTVTTDEGGIFSLQTTPFVKQAVTVEKTGLGRGSVEVRAHCGAGTLKLELGPTGVRLVE